MSEFRGSVRPGPLVRSAAARKTAAVLKRVPETWRLCGLCLLMLIAPESKLERFLNHRNAQVLHIP